MLDGYKTWYSGCDYVRLTLKPVEDYTRLRRVLRQTLLDVMVTEEGEVPELTRWAWLGYVGEGCAHGAYGLSYQGGLLQASGAKAQALCEVRPLYDGVPRIDMQFTLVYDKDRPNVARDVANASAMASRGKGGTGWGVAHIDGFGKGDTCYLGSRTSDMFIRVYDKSRERGDLKHNWWEWRIECEFKGKEAAAVYSEYQEGGCRMEHAVSIVARTLKRRGIEVPLPADVRPTDDIKWEIGPTSAERRLAWFSTQVAPSIEKVLAAGYSRDDVLAALGLS